MSFWSLFANRRGRTYVTFRNAEQTRKHEENMELIAAIASAIAIVVIPIVLARAELHNRNAAIAFYEVEPKIVKGAYNARELPKTAGKVVHIADTLRLEDGAEDAQFNLGDDSFARLRRRAEYCQWQEHVSTHTEKDSQGNSVTTKSYSYHLGWHPHRISSLFFDQPFAHSNPQRDPAPDREFTAPSAQVGAYTVPSSILERMSGWRRWMPSREHVDEFRHSQAADEFKYVGDGWFYSPYDASTTETLLRLAGRVFEGSMDFQLGELFAGCKAGDVRVRYEVIDPKEVSVIAVQPPAGAVLRDYVATNGFSVGLAQAGLKGPSAMFHDELALMMSRMRWLRLIALGWGVAAVILGRRFAPALRTLGLLNSALGAVLGAAFAAALCHGLVWGAASWTALAVLAVCALAFPFWVAAQVRDVAAIKSAGAFASPAAAAAASASSVPAGKSE